MNFFNRNAGLIIAVPWALLSARKLWDAIHHGDHAQYFAAVGFGGVALLFYLGQSHINKAGQEKRNQTVLPGAE